MTEDEALKKWCPFVRAPGWEDNSGSNRDRAGEFPGHGLNCIGSACMAWRWHGRGSSNFADKISAIKAHRAEHNSSLFEAKIAVEAGWGEIVNEGFCGLAGSPQ